MIDYRKSRGLSQEQLAGDLGINPCTLRRWEKSKGKMSQKVLDKLRAIIEQDARIDGHQGRV